MVCNIFLIDTLFTFMAVSVITVTAIKGYINNKQNKK